MYALFLHNTAHESGASVAAKVLKFARPPFDISHCNELLIMALGWPQM
jgi:hypothetical protein